MVNHFLDFLTSFSSFEFLALLALAAAKAALMFAFVAALCSAFRRFSAATRHLLWAAVLCASLLLPFLSFVQFYEMPILPASMPVLPNTAASNESSGNDGAFETMETPAAQSSVDALIASDDVAETTAGKVNSEFSDESQPPVKTSVSSASPQKNTPPVWSQIINWTLAVWVAGALLLLVRLLIGAAAGNLLARRAGEFKDRRLNELFSSLLVELNLKDSVRLLSSECTLMPIVCGIMRPAVLLPAGAEQWSEERRRIVLLHELTHVARRDCLTQMLGQAACAFYWFNPFVWSAARRLRVERERACDDFVLSVGTKPSDYARHLLEIARLMQERSVFNWSQTSSVAMARRSQLEGRLLAILSAENARRPASRTKNAALVGLICVLFFSLAVIRPTVIEARNQQITETDSEVQTNDADTPPVDSLSTTDSELPDNAATLNSTSAYESIRKRENNVSPADNLQKKIVSPGRMKADDNRRDGKPDIERDVAANPPQQAENVQMPDAEPSSELAESESSVNAGNQLKPNARTQKRSEDFIDEMASVGYANLSIDELIDLKSVGVTAGYVGALRELGFDNLTAKELIKIRAVGATPAYIEGIRSVGYKDLTLKELANLKALDIMPEHISKYRAAGYDELSVKNLIGFAANNITPDFINGMNALGFGKLSPKDLVLTRVFRITPEFVQIARNRLGNDLTLKQIVELKNTGILRDNRQNLKPKEI